MDRLNYIYCGHCRQLLCFAKDFRPLPNLYCMTCKEEVKADSALEAAMAEEYKRLVNRSPQQSARSKE